MPKYCIYVCLFIPHFILNKLLSIIKLLLPWVSALLWVNEDSTLEAFLATWSFGWQFLFGFSQDEEISVSSWNICPLEVLEITSWKTRRGSTTRSLCTTLVRSARYFPLSNFVTCFFLGSAAQIVLFFFFFFVCAHREWSTCQVSGISTETWQHEISLWRVSWGWRLEISALPKFCLRTKSTTWSKSQERVPYSGQTSVKTYSICRLNYLLKRGRTDTYRVLIFLGMPLSLWLRASSLWPQMSGALEWCFMSSSPTVTKTAALLQ